MHTPGLAALRHVKVRPVQRKVLDVLINSFPKDLSVRQIADRVYADDPNGGPDGAENCVSVYLNGIRKAVKPLGWTAGTGGGHTGIRLRPLPSQAGQSL